VTAAYDLVCLGATIAWVHVWTVCDSHSPLEAIAAIDKVAHATARNLKSLDIAKRCLCAVVSDRYSLDSHIQCVRDVWEFAVECLDSAKASLPHNALVQPSEIDPFRLCSDEPRAK
jgi:hypothetical protein